MKKSRKFRKLSRKGMAVFAISALLFTLGFDLILAGENHAPVITTTPDRKWTIANYIVGGAGTPGRSFTEDIAWSGIIAYDPEDGELTSKVVMSGFESVDINTVGTYYIEFNVQDSGGLSAIPFVREINVREEGTLTPGRCYESIDPPDFYTVECEDIPQCSDSTDNDQDGKTDTEDPACHTDFRAENPSSYDPKIDSENQKPSISLLGDNPLTHIQGQVFTDPGATSSDPEDGDLTSEIVVSGDAISTSTATGTYVITYNVQDSEGLKADEVSRTVIVEEPEGLEPPCDSYGDVHMDGVINQLDFFEYVVHGSGGFDLSPEQQRRADVNGDGDIDVDDATMVMDYVTGEINTFPVCQATECSDLIDNDGDGLIDENDPGCENPIDDSENQKPSISLLGNNPLTHTKGQVFTDPGATSSDPEDGDLTSDIVVAGDEITTSTATGTYVILYNVQDSQGLKADEVSRTVNVIELGQTECSDSIDNDGDGYIDDKDPTCHTDGDAGNPASYDPAINTENQAPVITLIGAGEIPVSYSGAFTDPGSTALDFEDGDITAGIVVGGDVVETTSPGAYRITYNVQDSQGKKAQEVVRAVMVQSPPQGHTGGGGGSVIIVSSPTLIISEEKVEDNKDGTALVSWKTNASSTSQVVYGKESVNVLGESSDNYGYASTTVETTVLTVSHLVFVSGLEQGTKYYFRPVSDNAESKEAVGKEVSFEEETVVPTSTPPVITECNYLLEYLKIDKVNNPVEVRKLQTFLNNYEGFSLNVNGIFDEATFNAVNAFQLKYSEDVLDPWGVDFSTGYVYITTKKKVNEMYCQKEFPLTSAQEQEVASYRTWLETVPGEVVPGEEPIGMGETPTTTEELVSGEIATTTEELVLGESGLIEEEEDGLASLAIAGFANFRSKAISWLALILVILLLLYAILYFRLRKKKEVAYPAPPQNIPTA